jgi:histone H3/H4
MKKMPPIYKMSVSKVAVKRMFHAVAPDYQCTAEAKEHVRDILKKSAEALAKKPPAYYKKLKGLAKNIEAEIAKEHDTLYINFARFSTAMKKMQAGLTTPNHVRVIAIVVEFLGCYIFEQANAVRMAASVPPKKTVYRQDVDTAIKNDPSLLNFLKWLVEF